MTSRPIKKCPRCKKPRARRLLSAGAGFLFKGSGFHTTDYRPESYKKAAAAEKGGGTAAAPAADKPAAETKPADKAAPAKKGKTKK